MHIIREYTHTDIDALKQCIEELQDYERLMDPHRLEGVKIAHDYLVHLLELCKQGVGKIFVVEINNEVVGMVSIYIEADRKQYRTSHRFALGVSLLPSLIMPALDAGIFSAERRWP